MNHISGYSWFWIQSISSGATNKTSLLRLWSKTSRQTFSWMGTHSQREGRHVGHHLRCSIAHYGTHHFHQLWRFEVNFTGVVPWLFNFRFGIFFSEIFPTTVLVRFVMWNWDSNLLTIAWLQLRVLFGDKSSLWMNLWVNHRRVPLE